MSDDFDLRARLGLDQTAYEAGLKKAREQTQQFATVVETSVTRTTQKFAGALKSGMGQAAFAVQDFAVVLGQGGSNSLGRAIMSASNNIGMLGAGFGPWGMAAATGASVLSATLIPALLASADASKKATEGIERFLEQSNNIGKNVDLRRGFGRQLEDVLRGGGGGLPGLVRSLGHDREDIQAEMDKLEGQFNTSGKILESFHQGRERIKREAERIRWGEGRPTAGSMAAADKYLREEMEKLETLQNTIFRLQPEELQKRFPGQDIAPLLELQKQWGGLADKLREVEAAENKAKDAMRKPFPPEATGAHLRDSMEAARAEIAFLNKAAPAGDVPLPGAVPAPDRGGVNWVVGGPALKHDMPVVPEARRRASWAEELEIARRRNQAVENARDPNRDLFSEEARRERRENLEKSRSILEETKRTNDLLQQQINLQRRAPIKLNVLDAGPA